MIVIMVSSLIQSYKYEKMEREKVVERFSKNKE